MSNIKTPSVNERLRVYKKLLSIFIDKSTYVHGYCNELAKMGYNVIQGSRFAIMFPELYEQKPYTTAINGYWFHGDYSTVRDIRIECLRKAISLIIKEQQL